MLEGGSPLITGFELTGRAPLDYKTQAKSIADLLTIRKVYEGLTVYVLKDQTDDRTGKKYRLKSLLDSGLNQSTIAQWGTVFSHWELDGSGAAVDLSEYTKNNNAGTTAKVDIPESNQDIILTDSEGKILLNDIINQIIGLIKLIDLPDSDITVDDDVTIGNSNAVTSNAVALVVEEIFNILVNKADLIDNKVVLSQLQNLLTDSLTSSTTSTWSIDKIKSFVGTLVSSGLGIPQPFDASTETNFPVGIAGDNYIVTQPGIVQGIELDAGDWFFASGPAAADGTGWNIVETNRDQATTAILGLVRLATLADYNASNNNKALTAFVVKPLIDAINTKIGDLSTLTAYGADIVSIFNSVLAKFAKYDYVDFSGNIASTLTINLTSSRQLFAIKKTAANNITLAVSNKPTISALHYIDGIFFIQKTVATDITVTVTGNISGNFTLSGPENTWFVIEYRGICQAGTDNDFWISRGANSSGIDLSGYTLNATGGETLLVEPDVVSAPLFSGLLSSGKAVLNILFSSLSTQFKTLKEAISFSYNSNNYYRINRNVIGLNNASAVLDLTSYTDFDRFDINFTGSDREITTISNNFPDGKVFEIVNKTTGDTQITFKFGSIILTDGATDIVLQKEDSVFFQKDGDFIKQISAAYYRTITLNIPGGGGATPDLTPYTKNADGGTTLNVAPEVDVADQYTLSSGNGILNVLFSELTRKVKTLYSKLAFTINSVTYFRLKRNLTTVNLTSAETTINLSGVEDFDAFNISSAGVDREITGINGTFYEGQLIHMRNTGPTKLTFKNGSVFKTDGTVDVLLEQNDIVVWVFHSNVFYQLVAAYYRVLNIGLPGGGSGGSGVSLASNSEFDNDIDIKAASPFQVNTRGELTIDVTPTDPVAAAAQGVPLTGGKTYLRSILDWIITKFSSKADLVSGKVPEAQLPSFVKTVNSISPGSDGNVVISVGGSGVGVFPPVQNLAALKALDTTNATNWPDKWLINVEDLAMYYLDRDSSATPDDVLIVQPTTGVGRWIRRTNLPGVTMDTSGENTVDYTPADSNNTTGFFATLLTSGKLKLKSALDRIVSEIKLRVKSISINGGTPQTPDANGNIDLTVAGGVGDGDKGDVNVAGGVWTVEALQGRPVSSTAPLTNQIMRWNGSAWIPDTEAASVDRPYYIAVSATGTGDGFTQGNAMSEANFRAQWNAGNVKGGAQLYFKRGETYAPFTVANVLQGSAAKRTVIGSWGTDAAVAKPVIKCSATVSGSWSLFSTNVYRIPYTSPTGVVRQVFFNGTRGRLAQSNPYPITTFTNNQSYTASSLGGVFASSLVGSEVVYKHNDWRFLASVVQSSNIATGALTTNEDASGGLGVGWSIILQNQLQFLSGPGATNNDWYYDHAGGYLYVRATSTPTATVTASIYDVGFNFGDGSRYLDIQGIDIADAGLDGIYAWNSLRVNSDNVLITNPGITGLNAGGNTLYHRHTLLQILDAGVNSVMMDVAHYHTFTRCRAFNPGMAPNYPAIPFALRTRYNNMSYSVGIGILTQPGSRGNIFESADIANCAYIGLRMDGSNSEARSCTVNGFCKRLNDGGGIYFWAAPYAAPGGTDKPLNLNSLVTNCIVTGGTGDISLVPSGTYTAGNASGIYCDNGARNAVITGNLTYDNGQYGIYVNWDCVGVKVLGNIAYNNTQGQVCFQNYTTANSNWVLVQGCQLQNNILVSLSPTQPCVRLIDLDGGSTFNPFAGSDTIGVAGVCNRNYYINPYSSNIVLRNPSTNYSLTTWKSFTGGDAISYSSLYSYAYVSIAQSKLDLPLIIGSEGATAMAPLSSKDLAGNSISNIMLGKLPVAVLYRYENLVVGFRHTFTGSAGLLSASTPEVGTMYNPTTTWLSVDSNIDGAGNVTGQTGFSAGFALLGSLNQIVDVWVTTFPTTNGKNVDIYSRLTANSPFASARFPSVLLRLTYVSADSKYHLVGTHFYTAASSPTQALFDYAFPTPPTFPVKMRLQENGTSIVATVYASDGATVLTQQTATLANTPSGQGNFTGIVASEAIYLSSVEQYNL